MARYRLYVLVVLIAVGSTGLLWLGLLAQFEAEGARVIESKRQENNNLAKVFEEHVARTVRAAEITLTEMRSEYRRVGKSIDLIQYAKERSLGLDPYNHLGIVDDHGDLVATSYVLPQPMNYRQFDTFRYQSTAGPSSPQPYLSVPRISTYSKKLTMFLSLPLNPPNERFAGVALVGMDPLYFSKIYADLDLGPGAIVTLIGRDGVVRARSTGGDLSGAQNVSDTLLFKELLPRSERGSYVGASPVDKVTRIISYRALKDYPLVVLVGTPQESALAAHHHDHDRYRLAAVVATAVILSLGLFALYQIRRWEHQNEERHALDEQAEQTLQRERDFAEGLIDATPAIVLLLDNEGAIQHVNPFFERLTGFGRQEVLGKDWFETFVPANRRDRDRAMFKLGGHHAPTRGVVRPIMTRDGTERDIEWSDHVMRDPHGVITGALATGQDVTARLVHDHELERLAAIVRHSSDLVAVLDMQGRMQFVNEAGRGLIGWNDEAACTGTCLTDLLAGADHASLDDQMMRAALARGRWLGEVDLTHSRTGARIPVLLDLFRIDDPATGGALNLGAVGRDLRERRAGETRLNEAQRIAMLGSWELDLSNGALIWSDEIFRLFEIDKNRFAATYEAFLAAIHPDDRALVNEAYVASLEQRKPYEVTHRLLMADGRVKWVQERCESEFDASGKPVRSLGTVQDITRQVQADEALRASEARYHSVVAALSEGIVLNAKDGAIVAANASAQRILGLSWDQMQGRTPIDPLWRAVHEDGTPFPGETHPGSVTLRTGQPQHNVVMGVHTPGGHLTWISINSHPIFQPGDAAPSAVVASFVDITERKRAQAELQSLNEQLEQRVEQRTADLRLAREEAERANAAKSSFLSHMSHELRTPLNAVIGFGQLLATDTAPPLTPLQLDNVQEILQAGGHLLELINEVLDLSRIESGRIEITLEPILVGPVLESCVRQMEPMAAQRGVDLVLARTGQAEVLADAVRFRQVLLNLLSNAVKYNRQGGRVELTCARSGSQRLRISVRDTGEGIAAGDLPRLFQPFERLASTGHSSEGTGIGLALSKRLVEVMHGTLGLHSEPGQGSTFWFELPLAPVRVDSDTPAPTPKPTA